MNRVSSSRTFLYPGIKEKGNLRKEEAKMATSSIDHNFVVKEKQNVERLISALTTPNTEVAKPTKSVSGKEAVTRLMKKWKNAR